MSNHQQTPPPPPPGANLPQGQPYGEAPGPGPRKRSWFARHKVLTGILGVLALFVIIGALGGGDDESPGVAAQTTAGSTDPAGEGTGPSASSPGSTADGSAAEEESAAEDAAREDPAEEAGTPTETEDEAGQNEEPTQEDPAGPRMGDVVTVGDFAITVDGVEEGLSRVGDEMFGEDAQGQFVKVQVTVENTGNSAEYFFDSEQKLIDDQDRQHSTSSSSWLLDEENLFLAEINPGNKVVGVLLYDIPQDAVPTAVELQANMFGKVARVQLTD